MDECTTTCTYEGTDYALLEDARLDADGEGFRAPVWPVADIENADRIDL